MGFALMIFNQVLVIKKVSKFWNDVVVEGKLEKRLVMKLINKRLLRI